MGKVDKKQDKLRGIFLTNNPKNIASIKNKIGIKNSIIIKQTLREKTLINSNLSQSLHRQFADSDPQEMPHYLEPANANKAAQNPLV